MLMVLILSRMLIIQLMLMLQFLCYQMHNNFVWDSRDAHAHALIALSMKCVIIPHICYCKIENDAWDTLTK